MGIVILYVLCDYVVIEYNNTFFYTVCYKSHEVNTNTLLTKNIKKNMFF